MKLPPGTQTYDFQCNLPKELPTSVEGTCAEKNVIEHCSMNSVNKFGLDVKNEFVKDHFFLILFSSTI